MTSGEFADATIVFDLDGTLVDTAPDLARALNETLDLEGLPHLPLEKVRRMVGGGARALIESASALAGAHFSAERLDQLTSAYIEFYRVDIARESTPFPETITALDALAAAGAKLSVCTNKRTDLSLQLLDALGFATRFSAIVGADSAPNRKPHPDHYRAAVERAGGEMRRSLMVGDTAADVAAARGAGAPVALVRFGYAADEVERLGADALLDRFSDLVPTCRRLLHPPSAKA
ncbi:MAG TPA: phosphoglycolate phosphatase [Caulobacterales bacterium]|nr:phosphoglycolate phosphatase [Caulobacterales bacterium]